MALDILLRVAEGAFSDLALDGALGKDSKMDPRDRGLVTELVYGVLRHQARLDFALSHFLRKPLARVKPPVLMILRLGAYQLLNLDRIPHRAAVHATVELTSGIKLSRATGFVNGVLRSLARNPEAVPWPDPVLSPLLYLTHWLSLPEWLAVRWLDEFGFEEAAALGQAMLEPAPFTLRVNTLKVSREEYLERLHQAGRSASPTRYASEGLVINGRGEDALPGSADGWFQVQDEASMLIAHLLGPLAGERILDACSAPGGKTTHIAALTGNRAKIMAFDLHPRRLELVVQGAKRLGCEGIETKPWDFTTPPDFLAGESCDRILVDAPCSGLGVLRRNPETRWRRTGEDIGRLAKLQRTILDQVAPLLRPGGALLYSVCTLTPEETKGVVQSFLASHPDFTMEDLRGLVPQEWGGLIGADGALHTFPHRHDGMDGFYAVRFRKT
jgi:16S rRNA (cytosine967-C5)-methyltransferase